MRDAGRSLAAALVGRLAGSRCWALQAVRRAAGRSRTEDTGPRDAGFHRAASGRGLAAAVRRTLHGGQPAIVEADGAETGDPDKQQRGAEARGRRRRGRMGEHSQRSGGRQRGDGRPRIRRRRLARAAGCGPGPAGSAAPPPETPAEHVCLHHGVLQRPSSNRLEAGRSSCPVDATAPTLPTGMALGSPVFSFFLFSRLFFPFVFVLVLLPFSSPPLRLPCASRGSFLSFPPAAWPASGCLFLVFLGIYIIS